MERVRMLFGKRRDRKAPQIDPLKPDFDIDAWLDQRQELRENHPENIDRFIPTGPGLLLGLKDHGSPEEMAEQERRLAEWERQEEEAKRTETASAHRTS